MAHKGTVKWFNSLKGYGFIKPDGASEDVFVHASAVARAGLQQLNEGQVVLFEIATSKGKSFADNIQLVS